MNNLLSKFAADESGAGAVEYALVLLLALAIVTLVSASLKTQVSGLLTNIGGKLNTAVTNFS
jgi:Flp pilus assembly pilin Flp